jgi:hypothetical protein
MEWTAPKGVLYCTSGMDLFAATSSPNGLIIQQLAYSNVLLISIATLLFFDLLRRLFASSSR